VETIVERPAALDVHKAQVMTCVRVPDKRGRREQHVQEFATTVRGLLALRDWLAGYAATQVVMEATAGFDLLDVGAPDPVWRVGPEVTARSRKRSTPSTGTVQPLRRRR
jgi:hypothetical protein